MPDLSACLEEVTTDFKKWVTTYRCKNCGQYWEERYEGTGHGEVASLYKVEKS
jgi:hypothetical protein